MARSEKLGGGRCGEVILQALTADGDGEEFAIGIIPALYFDEPNWESGKNVWLSFRRADGQPWGLAGMWTFGATIPEAVQAACDAAFARLARPILMANYVDASLRRGWRDLLRRLRREE